MEIEGKLHVNFEPELNNAGQRPLSISFVAPDGIKLEILGVRFKNGHVLDATAVTARGWAIYHTQFSPELQSVIKEARKKEQL